MKKKEGLSRAQIEQVITAVKMHYSMFDVGKKGKATTNKLAEPYADSIFTRLTTGQLPMRVRDAFSPLDISFIRFLEESLNQTPNEVLEAILQTARTRVLEWHIATQTAALFIEQGKRIPDSLARFCVSVLRGETPEPKTGYSTIQNRDDAIASCIHWITTNDPSGLRKKLGIKAPIAEYAKGNALGETACDLVKEALEQTGELLTSTNIEKIWKRAKPN